VTQQEKKKVKRRILVLYDFSPSAENALRHGLKMCAVLRSHLTLVFPLIHGMTTGERSERKTALSSLITEIRREYDIEADAFAPEQPLKNFFRPLYEKVEGIMIVAGISGKEFVCRIRMNQFLKMVRRSRIPWLTVPETAPVNDYNHIVLPLSYNRQSKEKTAWASYFHRLNQSAIHALVPVAKDGFIKTGIYKNTEFLKKMYSTLDIYYKLIPTEKNIHQIDPFAIEYAVEHTAAPVIVLVTPRPDLFDLLSGAVERKIIMNTRNVPVLCINPLDDMYVVCS
jgi:hypothetical protein